MASKRGGLASTSSLDPKVAAVATPLNDIVNRVTGVTLPKIAKLKKTATLADVINKINEVIVRLQED